MRPLFSLVLMIVVACAGNTHPETVVLPGYDGQAVTEAGTAALVGTVVDSASGIPIESAQVLLSSVITSRPHYVFTDARGGFVLGRLEPGMYTLLIRKVGFYAFRANPHSTSAGKVDTLRVRLRADTFCHANNCNHGAPF